MRLNVTSEIGRLRSVLVHLPGREIDQMVPPMMAQLLFDDILYGQVAREEHRRFQQLIRFVADEVLDIQDLLEEIFEDEEVKEEVVRDVARRNRLGRPLVGRLLELKPGALAEVLIAGIARETGSGELPKFDLFPIPNLFFMRDPQVVLGDRVVISSMATQARRRESLLSRYVFRYHPHFRGHNPFWVDFMEDEPKRPMPRHAPTLEGGDVLVPRRDLLLVGVTERTNKAGVEALMRSLKAAKAGVKSVIIVDIPRARSFMHLDTIFTFISRHE
jgi:arginine deiminase